MRIMNSTLLTSLLSLSATLANAQDSKAESPKPGMLASFSSIACLEVYDSAKASFLPTDNPFFQSAESCDLTVFKTACVLENERNVATWWRSDSAECSPGWVRFTERDSLKAHLEKNEALYQASIVDLTSIETIRPDFDKYCVATMKETVLFNSFETLRATKGQKFFVEDVWSFDAEGAGTSNDRSRISLLLPAKTNLIHLTVDFVKTEVNCELTYMANYFRLDKERETLLGSSVWLMLREKDSEK